MSAPVELRRLPLEGTQARVIEAGPGDDGEAVVFVHGNPGSADDWVELAGAVAAAGSRAVALDLPSFGETPPPAGFEQSVPAQAGFLGAGLQALDVERAHLVLHDFGGPIGLLWAAMHPERVASVTLIDTGVLPGYRWHWAARVWRTPLLGEAFQAMATRRVFRWTINRAEPQGLPRPFLDRMYDQYDRGTRRAVLGLYRATDEPGTVTGELIAALAPHDIPALVIWGRSDAYLPSRYAERQREAFPSAHVHVLEGSGHWPFVDAAADVEHLLVEFLQRARQPAA